MSIGTTLISGACDIISWQSDAGSVDVMAPWHATLFNTATPVGNLDEVSHIGSGLLHNTIATTEYLRTK